MKLPMIIGVIGILGIPAFASASPPTYAITDLGLGTYVYSIAINNQVLAAGPSGDGVLFHPDGTITDLSILVDDSAICFGPAGNAFSYGSGNNNGTEYVFTVVDSSFGRSDCGITYQNGAFTLVNYYTEGNLIGVNDSGQIIGYQEPTGFGPNCNFNDNFIFPIAINDSGQIVADYNLSVELCTNGNWTTLPSLPGATSYSATAINKHGTVVGTATINGKSHGFFTSATGITTDLGINIQVNDINALQQSVGNYTTGNNHSFMRVAGVTSDLNTLTSATDPLQPYVTFADPSVRINDNGVIAVVGTDSRTGLTHVYLLKPT